MLLALKPGPSAFCSNAVANNSSGVPRSDSTADRCSGDGGGLPEAGIDPVARRIASNRVSSRSLLAVVGEVGTHTTLQHSKAEGCSSSMASHVNCTHGFYYRLVSIVLAGGYHGRNSPHVRMDALPAVYPMGQHPAMGRVP